MSEPSGIRLARALRDIHVRFARDAEGMMIAQMVHGSHDSVPNTGWEKVCPYWLVAEHEGEVVGTMQICYSSPIGRLEFLSFIPGLSFRIRGLVAHALLSLGSATLQKAGCHAIAGAVPVDQKQYQSVLKANGCSVLTKTEVMVRSIS